MSKKHVYRIGDKVWINVPRKVERVGYPKSVYDYLPKDGDKNLYYAQMLLQGQDLKDVMLLQENGLKNVASIFDSLNNHKVNYKVQKLAAYLRARADGFGGKKRSIHFLPLDYWPGCQYATFSPSSEKKLSVDIEKFTPFQTTIRSKRVVRTGTYFPPYAAQLWDYDNDSLPGGLSDAKSHVIVNTDFGEFVTDDISPVESD